MKRATPLSVIVLGICLSAGAPNLGAASPIQIHGKVLDAAAEELRVDIAVARRGGFARRTTFVGPRGGIARTTTAGRRAVVRPGVVRPGWHGAGTRVVRPVRPMWSRPAGFWWRPGGAVAAGAAIGFVTAATAAAWAGAAPGPNMCWYYTDSTRTRGFWDACP